MTHPLGPSAFPKVEQPWKMAMAAKREERRAERLREVSWIAAAAAELDARSADTVALFGINATGKTWSHHYRDVTVQRFFAVLGARIADVQAGRPAEGRALDERIKKLQLERVELDVKQQEGR